MIRDENRLIEMKDIGVRRDGKWLVRHVDLQVHSGEIITIVGPNGSGKSSTIKTMAGILKPTEGNLVRSKSLSVGYVPQKLELNTTMPMSVRRMMKLAGRFDNNSVDQALNQFQIDHLENAQVSDLSGGELQRLLIARATLAAPQLLILDEPSQGIDFYGQMEIYNYIRQYRDDTEAAIVLVSHDLHLVMAATDRVICMNGHVCCSGTPEVIAQNPNYLEMFGPGAGEAMAIYRHSHDHVHLPDGRVQHADGSITHDCHPGDGHHHD